MAGIDIISDTTGKQIVESILALGAKMNPDKIVYGIHINGNDGNPNTNCRYLMDAVGMLPSKMNYASGTFDYGSWADAFFIPRPCMLKYDGTVDYYLDENDYSKKSDGTASDIGNIDYAGNAMMEWGNGTDIWMKIVPDKGDKKSGSIYFANCKADEGFETFNHTDENGNYIPHFYTPIYNGSLDSSSRLRSISGQSIMRNKTAQNEMDYAANNGTGWYIEQWGDRLLINCLLILMAKSTDTQTAFGRGYSENSSSEDLLLKTGTMDAKGLFWGEETGKEGVKVFGMENWWGNQWRRTCGLILANGTAKVKLTPATTDGSTVKGYNTNGAGYVAVDDSTPIGTSGGYIKEMQFTSKGMFPQNISGSSSTYYCDGCWFNNSITAFAYCGGALYPGRLCGAFSVALSLAASIAWWPIGAAPSCKPLAH